VLVGSAMNFEPAEPAQWKRYRGGSGGKIWYSPDGSHYTRILANVGDNLVNPMFVGSRVVFLSDHEGTGALYSAFPDGMDLRRHTGLGQYYARHATTDGRRVVYQRAGEIWQLESLDADPVRLDIRLSAASPGRAPYPVSAKSQLRSFTLDAAGQALGAEVRGTVHWLPGRDGPARTVLAEPGVRARLPLVIPGTDTVACASDRGGEDGLDVIPADGSAARRIGHGVFGRITELAAAPDGRTAAVACADGRLLTVALDGEPVITEIARSANEEIAGLVFSPDSALLAWSQPWLPERAASQIRLARLADGTVTVHAGAGRPSGRSRRSRTGTGDRRPGRRRAGRADRGLPGGSRTLRQAPRGRGRRDLAGTAARRGTGRDHDRRGRGAPDPADPL
jgi:tricorn protease